MKNKNTVGSNYFFHTLYQIVILLTPLITTPYVSRVLLPEGVGQYSYYYTLVQYFVIAGNLGFSTYGQIQIAKTRDDKSKLSKTFWEIFILRFFTFCVCSIAYFIFFAFSEHKAIMVILFGLMAAGALDISWLYFGMDDFKSISLRNIFVKVISVILIFAFVKSSTDVNVYTAILTASTFFGNLFIWKSVGKLVGKPHMEGYSYKQHFKPSIAFFLPNIAVMIYTMVDKTMIGIITQSNYQNGLYEQAHKVEQILVQFLLSIGVVYRSQMARLFEIGNFDEARKSIENAIKLLLLVAFPMCFGLISVSRDLVGWFLGNEYLECIPLLCIFSVLLIVISISNCMSNMYMIVTDKQDKFQKGTYAGAIVNIICNAFLIPKFGALGAAAASVLAELTILLVFYHYSKQMFRLSDYGSSIFKYTFFCALMLVAIQAEMKVLKPYKLTSLIIEILTGVLIYFIGLLTTRDKTFFKIYAFIKKKFWK